MRKLTTIQVIKDILPIKGADNIELLTFENIGWKCISTKEIYKEGDKCIYFEIDSFLPLEDPNFKFLEGCCKRLMYNGFKGYRLKTMKLRGVVSQGLAMPINLYPELNNLEVGTDVSNELNVNKWEQDPGGDYQIEADYPGFIIKSDQTRIQSEPEYFELFKHIEFEESLKLDGSSTTIFDFDNEVKVCGRNNVYQSIPDVPPWKLANEMGLLIALKELNLNIGLQAELMGPGLHKNREQLRGYEFYLFNIFDIKRSRFFKPEERNEITDMINYKLNEISGKELKQAPVLREKVKIFEECENLEELLSVAKGASINNKIREGNVYKSREYIIHDQILQFKMINNEYLLKGGN